MTSTLTALLTGAALGQLPSGWRRSTGALLAIVAGAALGALAAIFWAPGSVPAVILIPRGRGSGDGRPGRTGGRQAGRRAGRGAPGPGPGARRGARS